MIACQNGQCTIDIVCCIQWLGAYSAKGPCCPHLRRTHLYEQMDHLRETVLDLP